MPSRLKTALGAVAVVLVLPVVGSADVITFGVQSIDPLLAAGPVVEGAFTYRAVSGIGWEVQSLVGNPAGALTTYFNGQSSATGDTVSITLTGGGPFTFDSVDTSTFSALSSDEVTITGFLGAGVVGSLLLNTSTPSGTSIVTVASPFSGPIDRLDVVITLGSRGGARLLDNFTFNTAVPEPSSLALAGLGALGLLGAARHRRRAA